MVDAPVIVQAEQIRHPRCGSAAARMKASASASWNRPFGALLPIAMVGCRSAELIYRKYPSVSQNVESIVMKAARLHNNNSPFAIEDVPTPVPGPGQVLVKIEGAGPDLHIAAEEIPGLPLLQTLGHENAGWIEAFGPGSEGNGLEIGML